MYETTMEMFLLLVLLVVECPWNLVQYWFGVCVQTSVVTCLLSKLGNDRSVELS